VSRGVGRGRLIVIGARLPLGGALVQPGSLILGRPGHGKTTGGGR
jgi:hypothetical protein